MFIVGCHTHVGKIFGVCEKKIIKENSNWF
jgi:hypothetical protein